MFHTEPYIRNTILNVVSHRETNLLASAVFIILSTYVFLVSALNQQFISSFANNTDNVVITAENWIQYTNSTVSIFVLCAIAFMIAKIFTYLRLPSFSGAVLTGILFRNVPLIHDFIYIDHGMETIFCNIAFTIFLITLGFLLDLKTIQELKVIKAHCFHRIVIFMKAV
ncbi:hypothetical protein AB6A40_008262 [Gnathostoma spinigerum]|uniref:Uncharacterized protein n=1 Tax=Gnathostoma spinigerum TaxID=75299 RepID=A0ABD6EWV8_9BILA